MSSELNVGITTIDGPQTKNHFFLIKKKEDFIIKKLIFFNYNDFDNIVS